ncbi:MAG: hypothetical protein IJU35_07405 [Paludibacteraceae bacterium]|nr:hypothetical protein [Paludibacteraceae bacterium]
MDNENNKAGWLNKKTIIGGIVGVIVLICLFSTCGGGDDKKADDTQHENETRKMEASTLKLKGPDAGLFKVDGDYELKLVQLSEGGWEGRAKATYAKVSDYDAANYKCALECCKDMDYLDQDDVELQSGQYKYEEFSTLLAKQVGETEEITLRPYEYDGLPYDKAKKIYDNTRYVVIRDITLEPLTKEEKTKKLGDIVDEALNDDDVKDLKDAAKTAEKVLDAEVEMLKALGGLVE